MTNRKILIILQIIQVILMTVAVIIEEPTLLAFIGILYIGNVITVATSSD